MEIISSRLRAEFAFPGTGYKGSRYDWSGFVTQVTLDDRHTFCGAESLVPGSGDGGQGLCNEFGIFTPLGYDEAAPGDPFPKLGVGLLTRPDTGEYGFSLPYSVQPFPMQVTQVGNAIHIVIEPAPCRGLAARLEKTIRVDENRLSITYTLQNLGTKALRTEEYAHNYLSINGLPTGPDYTLTAPPQISRLLLADQSRKAETGNVKIEQDIRLTHAPEGAFYLRAADNNIGRKALAPAGSWWQLNHAKSGIGIREETDFGWGNFALYGTELCLCPEVFFSLNLMPGQTQTWSRRYTFFSS